MALNAAIVWEVRTTGADTNGGGFKTGASGTDYSQQAAAQLSLTDLACASNTTLTSATGGFTAAMVGNVIQIASGTNALAGWYEITAYSDTNTVTIDRTCATGGDMTDGVGKVGGALATPGAAALAAAVSGHTIWIQAGTYTLSTDTPGKGGPVLAASGIRLWLEGYQSSRGDLGTKPVIDVGAVTAIDVIKMVSTYPNNSMVKNIEVDGQDNADVYGFRDGSLYGTTCFDLCLARDCPNGFQGTTSTTLVTRSQAISCAIGFSAVSAVACYAQDCTTGFSVGCAAHCLATGGTSGFVTATYNLLSYVNCVAYDCSSHGFDPLYSMVRYSHCVAVNCGGKGFDTTGAYDHIVNCAGYNNTGGNTGHAQINWPVLALTGDPFLDAAGGDFRPNNTAGAGAALRAAGFEWLDWSSNRDIGFQHADPVVGGGAQLGAFENGAWR